MQVLFKSLHPRAIDLRDLIRRRMRDLLQWLGQVAARVGAHAPGEANPRTGGARPVMQPFAAMGRAAVLDHTLARKAGYRMRLSRPDKPSRRLRHRPIHHER